jgi:hypothetical protein
MSAARPEAGPMRGGAPAASSRATRGLLDLLNRPWVGQVLNGLALALLAALALRHHLGYVPRFFTVTLPIAAAVSSASLAVLLARPTRGKVLGFLICAAAGVSTMTSAALMYGYLAPTAIAIYAGQRQAKAEVLKHSLPADPRLFRDGFDKTGLRSFSDLPREAGRFHKRWRGELIGQGLTESEAWAASLMLFTSTLWAFGNRNHPEKPGCISSNEDNDWQFQQPTFEAVKAARIGCCTDYAHALAFILSRNGVENRYVAIPGHLFNEAKIDGKWYVLDANTNVIMNSAWNDIVADPGRVRIHVFAHPGSRGGKLHRPVVAAFQDYFLNLVLVGEFVKGAVREGRAPDPEHKQGIASLY